MPKCIRINELYMNNQGIHVVGSLSCMPYRTSVLSLEVPLK